MVDAHAFRRCLDVSGNALQDAHQVGVPAGQLVHAGELFQNHRLVGDVSERAFERVGRRFQVADTIGVQPRHAIQGQRAHPRIGRQRRFTLEHRDQIVMTLMRRVQALQRQDGRRRARIGLECRLIQLGRRVIVALVRLEQTRALGEHGGPVPAISGEHLRRALIGLLQRVPGLGGERGAFDRAQRRGVGLVELERSLVGLPRFSLLTQLLVQEAGFLERDQRLLGGVRGRAQLGIEQRQRLAELPRQDQRAARTQIDGR